MAKKVVQGEENKIVKKKRHGCRNCLITLLIFIVVIGLGVYFTGNFFTKKYLDMSLYDCIGVLHDIRTAKHKKIVTNGYEADAYRQFDAELQNQMFLNSDAHFSVEELLDAAVSAGESETQALPASRANGDDMLTQAARSLGVNFDVDTLTHELTDLFRREHMDLEKLRAYDPALHEQTCVIHISDKMIASVINKCINIAAKAVEDIGDMLGEYHVENLSDVMRFEQLIFGQRPGTVAGESTSVKTVTATVSVKARTVANAFLRDATGRNLGFLTKLFLPDRLYVTAVVPVQEDAQVANNVYINGMNDAKMDRVYRLAAGITDATGSSLDLKREISDAVNGSVSKVMRQINRVFPMDKAVNGVVNFDVFETVIDLMKLNENEDGTEKPAEKQLHAPDLIGAIAGIVGSESDDAIKQQYDYNHQYYDTTGSRVVYVKTERPGQEIEGMEWLDYRALFMNELADKYMLDLTMGTPDLADDVTFEELMGVFGLGEAPDESRKWELYDLFDPKRLGDVLAYPDKRVKIDSRMLGAILQTQIDTMTGGSFEDADPVLEYVFTYFTEANNATHTMIEAAVSIDVAQLVSAGKGFSGIITGLVGERVVVTLNVDITPSADGFAYIPGELRYNGLSREKTDCILKTIAFFAEGFEMNELLAQIEQPVRDAINKMSDLIPVTICSSVIDSEATEALLPPAVELGSVFEAVKEMLFDGDDAITAKGIEDVLAKIDEVNDDGFEERYIGDDGVTTADGKPSYANSLQDILDKYYVANKAQYTSFDQMFGEDGIVNASAFNADVLDFDRLLADPTGAAALRPLFTDNDLAALLSEKMASEPGIYKDLQQIEGMRIEKSGDGAVITVYIALDAHRILGEAAADKARLFPADTLYLKAVVDTRHTEYYDKHGTGDLYTGTAPVEDGATPFYRTELSVNNMDETTYATLLAMAASMSGDGAALNLSVKARDIGAIVYERFGTLSASVGGELEFVDGGVRFASVYEYIRSSLLPEESDVTAEQVKEALQGLGQKSAGSSQYNYDASVFGVNEIAEGKGQYEGGRLTVTDRVFGYGLANGFTLSLGGGLTYTTPALIGGNEAFTLQQLNILADSLSPREEFLNGFRAEELSVAEGALIEFTFALDLRTLAKDSALVSQLPECAYATVLLRQKGNEYELVYCRINALTESTQGILLQLAHIDFTRDLKPQIDECLQAMNGHYAGAAMGRAQADGIGSVTFTVRITA